MDQPFGSRDAPDDRRRQAIGSRVEPDDQVPWSKVGRGDRGGSDDRAAAGAGASKADEDDAPIALPVPPRRGLDAAVLLALLLPAASMQMPILYVWLHELLAETLELPSPLPKLGVAGAVIGAWGVFLGLLFARAARYSGVHVDAEGLVVGTLGPPPRGTRHRWRDLAGFAVTSTGVLVAPRRRSWLEPARPVLPCEGEVLHRVVTRLEAHGVPRLDG